MSREISGRGREKDRSSFHDKKRHSPGSNPSPESKKELHPPGSHERAIGSSHGASSGTQQFFSQNLARAMAKAKKSLAVNSSAFGSSPGL